MYNDWLDLAKKLRASEEQYNNIKNIIINEDKRSSVQSNVSDHPSRPSTANGYKAYDPAIQQQRSQTPSETWSSTANGNHIYGETSSSSSRPPSAAAYSSGRSTPVNNPTASRPKPTIRPKPEALHGHAITHEHGAAQNPAITDLHERWARLRISGQSAAPTSQPRADNAVPDGPTFRIPSPSDYISSPAKSSAVPNALRPGGPRDMPPLNNGPIVPPKLPLDTSIAVGLPKPPSPTYSPARNMQTPGGINPPRSTARSVVGTGGRKNSITSSISSRTPGGDDGSYFPRTNEDVEDASSRRRGSVGLPREGRSINAQMLFDYMRLYDILLIDVRDRQQFDDGHIDHSRILCVEPLTLRLNMSAEELQGALVLSPDIEQALFERRDRYELIVYYDQSTLTSAFLSRTDLSPREEPLKILYDALVEFNFEHPLRRPPLLLEGGLDAWEDLLGRPALKTSDTYATKAEKAKSPKRKPVPIPSHLPELTVEKKRRGTFNPLGAEEARKWEEKARAESLPLELMPPVEDEIEEEEEEAGTPFYNRTTEDFLRRYPAIEAEPESMVQASTILSQYSSPPPISRPPAPPSYPAPGAPSTIPSIPSRPPPAAPRVSYSGAHERALAPFPANQRVSQLRPYVPPKDMPQNIRLPRTGLINFGVTCYMNATIQCLSATLPLTRIFRDGSYRRYIQRDNWKGSKGLLPEHYANLIHHLWRDDVTACRPSTFRSFCARLNDTWGKNEQQDAKEFYDFVIDFLHEDMNISWRNPPPHVLSPAEEGVRERMHPAYASMIEWTRWSKRDKSPVSDLFAGQHASRLRCLACGTTSTTYETFYSISIEIPRSGAGHIYSCLDSYCQEEKMTKGWKCPNCKKERDATKRIFITRAPRNLVVHFKRFESVGRGDSARKVRTPIEFPLSGLDISKHMQQPPSPSDTDATVRVCGDNNIRNMKIEESMTPPFVYDAYGVIRHIGASINRGHYIACVRDPGRGRWRTFNDDRVVDFDPEVLDPPQRLQGEEAYILFFERRMQGL